MKLTDMQTSQLARRDQLFEKFGEPTDLDELAIWVQKVIEQVIPVTGFAWSVTYNPEVSNSHSRPILGVENFRRNPEFAQGYPGFYGRVWIRYGEYPRSFGSAPFTETFTHTGTGGIGAYDGPWATACRNWYRLSQISTGPAVFSENSNYKPHCFSWDYRFYLEDFPAVRKYIEQQQLIHVLKHGRIQDINHKYIYTDPDAQSRDAELWDILSTP